MKNKTKKLIQFYLFVVFLTLVVMAAFPAEVNAEQVYTSCAVKAGIPFWMVHVRNESYMPPAGTFGTRTLGITPVSNKYIFTRPFTNKSGFTVWVRNKDIYCIY